LFFTSIKAILPEFTGPSSAVGVGDGVSAIAVVVKFSASCAMAVLVAGIFGVDVGVLSLVTVFDGVIVPLGSNVLVKAAVGGTGVAVAKPTVSDPTGSDEQAISINESKTTIKNFFMMCYD
jgi:hypothetical protein